AFESGTVSVEARLGAEAGFVGEGWLGAEAWLGAEGRALRCPVECGFAIVGAWVFGGRECVGVVLYAGGRLRGGEAVGPFFFPGLGEAGAGFIEGGAIRLAGEGAAFA